MKRRRRRRRPDASPSRGGGDAAFSEPRRAPLTRLWPPHRNPYRLRLRICRVSPLLPRSSLLCSDAGGSLFPWVGSGPLAFSAVSRRGRLAAMTCGETTIVHGPRALESGCPTEPLPPMAKNNERWRILKSLESQLCAQGFDASARAHDVFIRRDDRSSVQIYVSGEILELRARRQQPVRILLGDSPDLCGRVIDALAGLP